MTIKMFEVRDSMTTVPVMTVGLQGRDSREKWLLSRSGYGKDLQPGDYVLFTVLVDPSRTNYDPFKWGDRTFFTAHRYIQEHWADLVGGEVIDVEYILKEKETPKVSEQSADAGLFARQFRYNELVAYFGAPENPASLSAVDLHKRIVRILNGEEPDPRKAVSS